MLAVNWKVNFPSLLQACVPGEWQKQGRSLQKPFKTILRNGHTLLARDPGGTEAEFIYLRLSQPQVLPGSPGGQGTHSHAPLHKKDYADELAVDVRQSESGAPAPCEVGVRGSREFAQYYFFCLAVKTGINEQLHWGVLLWFNHEICPAASHFRMWKLWIRPLNCGYLNLPLTVAEFWFQRQKPRRLRVNLYLKLRGEGIQCELQKKKGGFQQFFFCCFPSSLPWFCC